MTICIRSRNTDEIAEEYGGWFRRIYPWPGVACPPWGAAFMSVAPGKASNAHSHDEEETFIFLNGTGLLHVDGETRSVTAGDVVYLPRSSTHNVENSSNRNLEFLCIWWGAPESEGDAQ